MAQAIRIRGRTEFSHCLKSGNFDFNALHNLFREPMHVDTNLCQRPHAEHTAKKCPPGIADVELQRRLFGPRGIDDELRIRTREVIDKNAHFPAAPSQIVQSCVLTIVGQVSRCGSSQH